MAIVNDDKAELESLRSDNADMRYRLEAAHAAFNEYQDDVLSSAIDLSGPFPQDDIMKEWVEKLLDDRRAKALRGS